MEKAIGGFAVHPRLPKSGDVDASVEIGKDGNGGAVRVDIEELLATRLLVQGNSGSGKSHLLRRLLEESAGLVQQVVIDPEGDFVTLSDAFGHVVIDGAAYSTREIEQIAARIRRHRASAVLSLEGLDLEAQMRCAAQFLTTLFNASRDQWYPMLVVVDEAQMFAPSVAGDVSDEARRISLGAMTDLMCRGRKRGLAGIIATQRLAKLQKNVAAEASNFLMGRTFLDIDMMRAADLLGMERRQAERIRDLERGQFLALGPAITRRPLSVKIGAVRTSAKTTIQGLTPLPDATAENLHDLIHDGLDEDVAALPVVVTEPEPEGASAEELMRRIDDEAEAAGQDAVSASDKPMPADHSASAERTDEAATLASILGEMAANPDAAYQATPALYQDFTIRCRMRHLPGAALNLDQFRRRFAMALAGFADPDDAGDRAELLAMAKSVSDDLLAPFLLLGRAVAEGRPCPDDDELARVYGTSSKGRIRRLLDHLERTGLIVVRTDFGGRRTVGIPGLGMTASA